MVPPSYQVGVAGNCKWYPGLVHVVAYGRTIRRIRLVLQVTANGAPASYQVGVAGNCNGAPWPRTYRYVVAIRLVHLLRSPTASYMSLRGDQGPRTCCYVVPRPVHVAVRPIAW
jgi:hypothetical protein